MASCHTLAGKVRGGLTGSLGFSHVEVVDDPDRAGRVVRSHVRGGILAHSSLDKPLPAGHLQVCLTF